MTPSVATTSSVSTPTAPAGRVPRDRGKHAPRDRARAPESRFGWPDVLRAVPGDETRSVALGLYRAAGFTPDDFDRLRAAREAMADALTRVEDRLEHARSRSDERGPLGVFRRALEVSLWP